MGCQRYETEGLTGFPATPELTEHVKSCGECQAAERSYQQLEKLVAVAGSQATPKAGWEDRLDARLRQQASRARFPIRLVISAVLAACLVLIINVSRRKPEEPSAMSAELLDATGARGAGPAIGSVWEVRLEAGQELRVWRNQKTLILRAPAGRPVVRVQLDAPGEYRAIALTAGTSPLDEPVSFDEDARLVRERGGHYAVLEPVVIR
jgi:hypothetical protein